MPSESGWRPSEGAKDALLGAGVGAPVGRAVGAVKGPCGPAESPWGVWIKAAGPWRI